MPWARLGTEGARPRLRFFSLISSPVAISTGEDPRQAFLTLPYVVYWESSADLDGKWHSQRCCTRTVDKG